jgi:hypothetical protein
VIKLRRKSLGEQVICMGDTVSTYKHSGGDMHGRYCKYVQTFWLMYVKEKRELGRLRT